MGVNRPPNATWTITLISKWGVNRTSTQTLPGLTITFIFNLFFKILALYPLYSFMLPISKGGLKT